MPRAVRMMPAKHCFAYGSLMCEDIMSGVCGHTGAGEPAILAGFARHPVRDEHYPGILPRSGAVVRGVLYRNVAPDALTQLDTFEGAQYYRTHVRVQLADGQEISADTYVFKPEYAHLLVPGDWNFEQFISVGKRHFITAYPGFTRR